MHAVAPSQAIASRSRKTKAGQPRSVDGWGMGEEIFRHMRISKCKELKGVRLVGADKHHTQPQRGLAGVAAFQRKPR